MMRLRARVFWLGVRHGWRSRGRGFGSGLTFGHDAPGFKLNEIFDRGVNIGRGHWRET